MVKLRDGREFDPTKYDERYKYNLYECSRGHLILSCDIDEGVTPMFITCSPPYPAPLCGATASSTLYPAPPVPAHLFPVKVVWRKPTKSEIKRAIRENYVDHYDKGGLDMEWIQDGRDQANLT